MSSTHEPVYWDAAQHQLAVPVGPATQTTYQISFPPGTFKWQLFNMETIVGRSPEIAGTLATITAASGSYGVPTVVSGSTWNVATGGGQTVFVRNRTPNTLNIQLVWMRYGRMPEMDAGSVVISADITP